MSYREENGQVVLTMSREDYERPLISLGYYTGGVLQRGGKINDLLALMNRLNDGNPNYTPYEVTGKS
jgi:hypothetical protein